MLFFSSRRVCIGFALALGIQAVSSCRDCLHSGHSQWNPMILHGTVGSFSGEANDCLNIQALGLGPRGPKTDEFITKLLGTTASGSSSQTVKNKFYIRVKRPQPSWLSHLHFGPLLVLRRYIAPSSNDSGEQVSPTFYQYTVEIKERPCQFPLRVKLSGEVSWGPSFQSLALETRAKEIGTLQRIDQLAQAKEISILDQLLKDFYVSSEVLGEGGMSQLYVVQSNLESYVQNGIPEALLNPRAAFVNAGSSNVAHIFREPLAVVKISFEPRDEDDIQTSRKVMELLKGSPMMMQSFAPGGDKTCEIFEYIHGRGIFSILADLQPGERIMIPVVPRFTSMDAKQVPKEFDERDSYNFAGQNLATLSLIQVLEIPLRSIKAVSVLKRKGVLHRDLKNEHFIGFFDSTRALHLKVIDFDFATSVQSNSDEDLVGTPHFIAWHTFDKQGVNSDTYALGMLLTEQLYYLDSYIERPVAQRLNPIESAGRLIFDTAGNKLNPSHMRIQAVRRIRKTLGQIFPTGAFAMQDTLSEEYKGMAEDVVKRIAELALSVVKIVRELARALIEDGGRMERIMGTTNKSDFAYNFGQEAFEQAVGEKRTLIEDNLRQMKIALSLGTRSTELSHPLGPYI